MASSRRQKLRSGLTFFFFLIFPGVYYYLSPYVPLMGAAEGVLAGSLLLFLVLFLTAPFFGRGFCGWVCPAGALQDQTGNANPKAFPRKTFGWLKYAVWTPWIGLILMLFHSAGGLKTVDIFYATTAGFSIDRLPALILYLIIALALWLIALLSGRRGACHTVCWMAPFMIFGQILGRKVGLPGLRLSGEKEKCLSCGACDRVCPMSLGVSAGVLQERTDSTDCILCGRCADGCPASCLKFTWRAKK